MGELVKLMNRVTSTSNLTELLILVELYFVFWKKYFLFLKNFNVYNG